MGSDRRGGATWPPNCLSFAMKKRPSADQGIQEACQFGEPEEPEQA